LEFRNNRPLYDWFIDSINESRGAYSRWGPRVHHPQQIEFARLNLTYTVMSKRFLLTLVQQQKVWGWDDPRMPTIAGIRRRGYPSQAIRNFCEDVGVTTQESVIDVVRLENAVRDHLNKTAPRTMCVLRPIKVTIENWPEGTFDALDFVINPEDPAAGTRKVRFGRTIYIEADDFMEQPVKGFFRLAPGQEVRLRWAYFITCTGVTRDASGAITGILATFDPATRGGDAPLGPDGKPTKKVKGTIHWVGEADAVNAEVRLFDRLFAVESPGERTGNYMDDLNPHSLEVVQAKIDPWLVNRPEGDVSQFERLGYFCVDRDSRPDQMVFNRTVTLKDTWAKESRKS
jgi:glutaminyl-tRNA synthetase